MSRPPDPEDLLRDQRWLRHLALSLCGDCHAADDLAQDTWTRALQQPGPRPGRGFLARVLRGLAVDRLRREARRKARFDDAARPEALAVQEHLVERVEAQRHLAEALLELEEPGRSIVLLRYQDGMSPVEIARSLQLAPGTVRSRLSRALLQLRGRLARRMGVADGELREALLPLLATPGAVQVGSGVGATAAWTLSMNIKLAATAGLAVLSLFVWQPWKGAADTTAERDANAAAHAPIRSGQGAAGTPAPGDRREQLAGGAAFGSAPGWWLEVGLESPASLDGARVEVSDLSGSQDAVLAAATGADGRVEIDLGRLFTHPHRLIRGLMVQVDHPRHLPVSYRIPIDRELRRLGLVGQRVRLPLACALQPATGRVGGVVHGPAGSPCPGVDVALFAPAPDTEDTQIDPVPVDHARTDAQGRFTLRAQDGTTYRIAAWERRPADAPTSDLKPTTAQVRAGDADLELLLEAGIQQAGYIESSLSTIPGLEVLVVSPLAHGHHELEETEVAEEEVEEGAVEVAAAKDPQPAPPVAYVEPVSVPAPDPDAGKPVRLATLPEHASLNLAWNRRRFCFARLRSAVQADGRVVLAGVTERTSYYFDELVMRHRGRPVRIARAAGNPLSFETASTRVHENGHDLVVRLKGHARLIEVRRDPRRADAGPAGSGWIFLLEDGAGKAALSGLHAGLVAVCSKDPMDGRWQVRGPGLRDAILEPASTAPVILDLDPAPGTGDLRIHLEGDAAHLVELCFLQLCRADGDAPAWLPDHRGNVRRRLHEPLTFRGLDAGRYRARLYPRAHPRLFDLVPPFVRMELAFEVFPGQESAVRARLERGGLLKISSPERLLAARGLPAGTRPTLALYDEQGRRIDLLLTVIGPPRSVDLEDASRVPTQARAILPALAPGRYTLEVGPHRTAVEVRAGEIVDLSPVRETAGGR